MSRSPDEYRVRYFTIESAGESFLQLARLRTRIFIDQEGWNLKTRDGLETDQFDHMWANYCLLEHKGRPVGGFRAIRTDKPYLLDGVFAEMAPQTGYPRSPRAWEISRFGILKDTGRAAGLILYAAMFEFARREEAAQLVALADLAHERLLHRLGIQTMRYSDVCVVGRDVRGRPVRAVAGLIPVFSQWASLERFFSPLLGKALIDDRRHVQGSDRVSA